MFTYNSCKIILVNCTHDQFKNNNGLFNNHRIMKNCKMVKCSFLSFGKKDIIKKEFIILPEQMQIWWMGMLLKSLVHHSLPSVKWGIVVTVRWEWRHSNKCIRMQSYNCGIIPKYNISSVWNLILHFTSLHVVRVCLCYPTSTIKQLDKIVP